MNLKESRKENLGRLGGRKLKGGNNVNNVIILYSQKKPFSRQILLLCLTMVKETRICSQISII